MKANSEIKLFCCSGHKIIIMVLVLAEVSLQFRKIQLNGFKYSTA